MCQMIDFSFYFKITILATSRVDNFHVKNIYHLLNPYYIVKSTYHMYRSN